MFHCTRCGECCRNVNKSHLYTNLDRGDGVCKVDESFDWYFKHTMSKEDYYNLNYQACQMLKKTGKKLQEP